MSLVEKSISVEEEVDNLCHQVVVLILELRSGTGVTSVILQELLKLQQLVGDFQALPKDYQESFSGTVKAVAVNAIDIAAALLGKN